MSTGIDELQDEMIHYAKREANGQTEPAQPSAYQHGRSKRDAPHHSSSSYDCNPMPRQRGPRLCLATGKAGQIVGESQVAQSERASQHYANAVNPGDASPTPPDALRPTPPAEPHASRTDQPERHHVPGIVKVMHNRVL